MAITPGILVILAMLTLLMGVFSLWNEGGFASLFGYILLFAVAWMAFFFAVLSGTKLFDVVESLFGVVGKVFSSLFATLAELVSPLIKVVA